MNVGDYVRTKKGIAKIIGKNDDVRYHYPNAWETDTYLEINDDTEYVYEEDIIKSAKGTPEGLLSLIEVGDYVNNAQVAGKIENKIIINLLLPFELEEKDIKSIVTKEQFESMEYKVGDE